MESIIIRPQIESWYHGSVEYTDVDDYVQRMDTDRLSELKNLSYYREMEYYCTTEKKFERSYTSSSSMLVTDNTGKSSKAITLFFTPAHLTESYIKFMADLISDELVTDIENVMDTVSDEFKDTVKAVLEVNGVVPAVKYIRNTTSMDLITAKKFVDILRGKA